MRTDDAADIGVDGALENRIVYIFPMYEFSHSLGQKPTNRRELKLDQCPRRPKADKLLRCGDCPPCAMSNQAYCNMVGPKRKTANAAVVLKSD